MEHQHHWVSLGVFGHIDVVRSIRGRRRVRSVYEIVEVCSIKGCSAGRTRDGIVFDDVTVGYVPEDELVMRTTQPLRRSQREGR